MLFGLSFLRLALLGGLVASIFSFGGGVWVTYKYFRVEQLEAQNRKLVEDGKRFRAALALGEKLDDENNLVEVGNKEITDAINRKLMSLTPPKPTDPVCLSADSMRSIRKLR